MSQQNQQSCKCTTRKRGWTQESPGSPWWVCGNCRLPSSAALNDCDTCDKKFKGIRPGLKFAYTCPDCEQPMTFLRDLHDNGDCGGSPLTCIYCSREEKYDPIESPFCIYGCTDYHLNDCPVLTSRIDKDESVDYDDYQQF